MKYLDVALGVIFFIGFVVGMVMAAGEWQRFKLEAMDIEYQSEKGNMEEPNDVCPLCGEKMDLEKTQRIIRAAERLYVCCVNHTGPELVSFIKDKDKEARYK